MYAASHDHADVIRLLLEADANIEALDNDGNTVIMVAVQKDHTDVVAQLLAAGANVNTTSATNGDAINALSVAAGNGSMKMLMQLLEAGADPNAIRHSRGSPLPVAMVKGHEHVVEALLRAGAEVWAAGHVLMEAGHAPKAARLRSTFTPTPSVLTTLPYPTLGFTGARTFLHRWARVAFAAIKKRQMREGSRPRQPQPSSANDGPSADEAVAAANAAMAELLRDEEKAGAGAAARGLGKAAKRKKKKREALQKGVPREAGSSNTAPAPDSGSRAGTSVAIPHVGCSSTAASREVAGQQGVIARDSQGAPREAGPSSSTDAAVPAPDPPTATGLARSARPIAGISAEHAAKTDAVPDAPHTGESALGALQDPAPGAGPSALRECACCGVQRGKLNKCDACRCVR
jgi:ankyrin repeat protein